MKSLITIPPLNPQVFVITQYPDFASNPPINFACFLRFFFAFLRIYTITYVTMVSAEAATCTKPTYHETLCQAKISTTLSKQMLSFQEENDKKR
jgi:hypothetical protein